MPNKDFAETFTCRLRLDEICRERGLVKRNGDPDPAKVSQLTGIHVNICRRMINNETKGIDFHNVVRLCLGLNVSPNDLFVIE